MNRIKVTMTRVTLHHLIGRLKTGICDLGNTKLLMVCFLGRNYWCIGHKGKVDPGIWHQVGLELGQIHIKSTIES